MVLRVRAFLALPVQPAHRSTDVLVLRRPCAATVGYGRASDADFCKLFAF